VLAATDILTGLESGLIDAVPTTPIAALSFQWFGLAQHMTDVKWAPLIGATVISTKTWSAIPENLRTQMLQSARDIGERLRGQVRPLETQAIQTMVDHGLVVHAVPPDIVADWKKGAQDCLPRIVPAMVPVAPVRTVEDLRDDYRAAHPSP